MATCMGLTRDGDICSRQAQKNGYCHFHQPTPRKAKETGSQVVVVKDTDYPPGSDLGGVKKMIAEIKDLETLKEAQKTVMQGLVDGSIDPKVGSAVSQMLKHHAELIDKTRPPEDELNDKTKQRVIDMAKGLSTTDAWNLMQSFVVNVKEIVREAKKEEKQDVVEASSIVIIEDQNEQ